MSQTSFCFTYFSHVKLFELKVHADLLHADIVCRVRLIIGIIGKFQYRYIGSDMPDIGIAIS